jgi:hypothetical protein
MDAEQDSLMYALIARTMGFAEEPEEAEIEQAGDQAQELLRKLDEVLSPLDSWRAPSPPADLKQRILGRIESLEKTISFEKAAAVAAPEVEPPRPGGWYFSVRDLVAAAACITLLIGLLVPGYRHARRIVERNACQNHMRQIYTGLAGFAEDHQGQLPYAGPAPQANWLPAARADGRPGPNARHMFLLAKYGYVPRLRVFICPSVPNAVPMPAGDCSALDNFPRARNVSYSMQNMCGPYRLSVNVDPNMVIVSDANPLFDGGVVRTLLGEKISRVNSRSHGNGAGQNVLYLSGRVLFAKAPTVGVAGDNIWQAGNLTTYTGTEAPQYLTDSFLVP